MRGVLRFTSKEFLPAGEGVLRAQGIPRGTEVPERIASILREALDLYIDLARPVSILMELSTDVFARVYEGEGRNDLEDPLGEIYPRAAHLALFALTLGEKISDRIARLFASDQFALGSMLDAAASEAADSVSVRLESRFRESLIGRGEPAASAKVLAYSPGYCGWDISGQKRLFETLRPEEIGITLGESFLMNPLKSVSGVLVAGPREIHEFSASFAFCHSCEGRACEDRMQRVAEQ